MEHRFMPIADSARGESEMRQQGPVRQPNAFANLPQWQDRPYCRGLRSFVISPHDRRLAATTTATAITTAATGKLLKINSVIIANIDGTNDADITLDLFRSSTAYKIISTVTVPADATLMAITKDSAIYLEEGDALRATASVDGDLQVICSYEIISE